MNFAAGQVAIGALARPCLIGAPEHVRRDSAPELGGEFSRPNSGETVGSVNPGQALGLRRGQPGDIGSRLDVKNLEPSPMCGPLRLVQLHPEFVRQLGAKVLVLSFRPFSIRASVSSTTRTSSLLPLQL